MRMTANFLMPHSHKCCSRCVPNNQTKLHYVDYRQFFNESYLSNDNISLPCIAQKMIT